MIVEILAKALKCHGVSVVTERWVPELAHIDEDGNDRQARLDLVVREHDKSSFLECFRVPPVHGLEARHG